MEQAVLHYSDCPNYTLVDSHCHLDLNHYDEDRGDVLIRAKQAGVGTIVNPGIDLEQSRQAVALAETFPEVYAAVGVHPNSSSNVDQETIETLRSLAAHPKVVAIGEIGLDYHWNKVAPTQQKKAFSAQLQLAAELGLPVIIHSRDSNDDVAEILEEWTQSLAFRESPLSKRPFAGVLHAFSGDLALAKRAYSWNFVLSLGGPVTFKNAHQLHELVPHLDLERLMLETDAPFLTPHPHRGKRNEPGHIALVCHKLASLYNLSVQQIAEKTSGLAFRFFQIGGLSAC